MQQFFNVSMIWLLKTEHLLQPMQTFNHNSDQHTKLAWSIFASIMTYCQWRIPNQHVFMDLFYYVLVTFFYCKYLFINILSKWKLHDLAWPICNTFTAQQGATAYALGYADLVQAIILIHVAGKPEIRNHCFTKILYLSVHLKLHAA